MDGYAGLWIAAYYICLYQSYATRFAYSPPNTLRHQGRGCGGFCGPGVANRGAEPLRLILDRLGGF